MAGTQSQSLNLDDLYKELEKAKDVSVKLHVGLAFMEASLSQDGQPNFKNFWEARKICTELFRENLIPTVRAEMWDKFSELTQEARRVKTLNEEEKAFESEQISVAIDAIEKEIENIDKVTPGDDLEGLKKSLALQNHASLYADVCAKLSFLSVYSIRIISLRKEIEKTTIRYQTKIAFFKRLSTLGDTVFPLRKELSKSIGGQFLEDIAAFKNQYFSTTPVKHHLGNLRDEIISLQHFAKELLPTGKVFANVRKELGICWDKLSEASQALRQSQVQMQQQYKETVEKFKTKIIATAAKLEDENCKTIELDKEFESISKEIRNADLGRSEVALLRDELTKARKPLNDKLNAKDVARVAKIKEQEATRLERIKAFEGELSSHLEKLDDLEISTLNESLDTLPVNGKEKETLQGMIQQIEKALLTKKENNLMAKFAQGGEDRFEHLKELYDLRCERLFASKKLHDDLRRLSGASGLDFEKSMYYNQEIHKVREEITDIESSIYEIEQQFEE